MFAFVLFYRNISFYMGQVFFQPKFLEMLISLQIVSPKVSRRHYESGAWSDLGCEDKCCSFEICQKTKSILHCTSGQLGC